MYGERGLKKGLLHDGDKSSVIRLEVFFSL